jgi:hypothetical protein
MKRATRNGLAALALVLTAAPAHADDGDAPSLPSKPDEAPPQLDHDQVLEQQMLELKEKLARSEDAQHKAKSPLSIHGYADLGFFVPNGNGGVGWVRDAGHVQMPQYNGYAWTFLGDILSTAVNSRGEVASLGDAPGVTRFDSVDSKGAPGFLVNEINLRLGYALTDQAIVRTSVDFMPRSGHDFSIGDFIYL